MKNNRRIIILLSATLLVMSVIPLGSAMFFFDGVFQSQEQIYKNNELNSILTSSQENLKHLSKLDPDGEDNYKRQFEAIQDLNFLYGEDPFFRKKLNESFNKYFMFGFGAAVLVSILLGVLLSFLINRITQKAFNELQRERERVKYLEDVARWQEIAKKLVHEIKRPLQPITTWVANLKSTYPESDAKLFQPLLLEASIAIEEEVQSLRTMMEEFSNFANLPKPHLRPTEVNEFFKNFINQYSPLWPQISFSSSTQPAHLTCQLDPTLFRQVLTNMIENAAEANLDQPIEIKLTTIEENNFVLIDVFNTGLTLNKNQREKIFDLYYSTKQNKKNMGLGLSIVKLIIIEHGGEIECLDETQGVRFRISLPSNPNTGVVNDSSKQ